MRNILMLLWFLGLLPLGGGAQAYHFSQFYTTPLLNNPAFTGYTEGPLRVAANFRSQWLQGGSPYVTGVLSLDVSPLRGRIGEGNKAGLGLMMYSDQSLGGAYQVHSVGLSAAYNLSMDPEGVHHLGVGLQGSFYE
ncbi:MAG TPA: type IX secretion system membrane protein PorP/SprF, partial [Chitinophagaceae bacterium]|nr:type IX secretion system membrane protein PorP/SprF [Chitinophagaceae bacterium]